MPVSVLTPEQKKTLIDRLSEGDRLYRILKESGVSIKHFSAEKAADPSFADDVELAVESVHDRMADEVLEIADGVAGPDEVPAAKLQTQVRLDILKRTAKRYSDKQEIDVKSDGMTWAQALAEAAKLK